MRKEMEEKIEKNEEKRHKLTQNNKIMNKKLDFSKNSTITCFLKH